MSNKPKGVSFATAEVATSIRSSVKDDESSTEGEKEKAAQFQASSESKSASFRSKVLRSNLTRTHKNRDPLFYYEVQQVLGVGSMGSVVKVRKRDAVVGGSARKDLRGIFQRERLAKDCMSVPIFGWIIKNCLYNPLANHEQQLSTNGSGSLRSLLSFGSSSRGSPFKPVYDSVRSFDTSGSATGDHNPAKPYEQTYAMKSIHLSRVTDPAFVEELRNEIIVLKALDHPHIGAFNLHDFFFLCSLSI